jgi:hypothetical protein
MIAHIEPIETIAKIFVVNTAQHCPSDDLKEIKCVYPIDGATYILSLIFVVKMVLNELINRG